MPRLEFRELVALSVLCVLAFILYIANNDFPLFYHADEFKKFEFVLNGNQDFKHPILLLQLARLGNLFFGFTDHNDLAVLCRTVSALAGIALIVAVHLLGRCLIAAPFHWLSTIAVAVSPIIAVHTHYFKEDMVFVASAMLAIFTYIRFLDMPSKNSGILFGIMLGFALAAQYKAVLLTMLFLLFPLANQSTRNSTVYKNMLIAVVLALVVALAINYPGVLDPDSLLWGISKETEHVSYGHTLRIYPVPEFFSFHLINSLLPGMTAGAAMLGIAGLIIAILRWSSISVGVRFLCIFCLMFYFAHEITPMKPAPAFMRYMIPIVPVLLLFGAMFVSRLKASLNQKFSMLFTIVGMSLLLIYPAYKSGRLVYNISDRDTRNQALGWLKENNSDEVYFGKFTLLPNKQSGRLYKLADADIEKLRSDGFRYVLASSFGYDLYYRGAEMKNQIKRVYRARDRFEYFFENYPYREFAPNYQSFAFSNPTIRIIDITPQHSEQPKATNE